MNTAEKFKWNKGMVLPGEKKHGFLQVGQEFELPVSVICGEQEGKTVLITAGIHAEEYTGIQAAVELAEHLEPERIAGTIIIIKAVNREAFEKRSGSEGIQDKKNLNWEFPGDAGGTQMQRLAYAIYSELFPQIDYYIDLHSGDSYEQLIPYVYYPGMARDDVVEISRNMARQADVPYMVRSTVSTGGAYNCAADCWNVPSILLKRGGMGAWSEEEVYSTRRDVRNILCFLGIYLGQRDYRNYYPLEVEDVCYQSASHGGLWYPVKKAGDMVRAQEVLGAVKNYKGEIQEVCRAEFDGVILYQTGSLQVQESGSMIAYGRIAPQEDDRKKRITGYWTKRSESFKEHKKAELHSHMASCWMEEIQKYLKPMQDRKGKCALKILDVGCGAGFFSILLAKEGHQVVGTDLTESMIESAKSLAAQENVSCEFLVMDAENLEFEDSRFDVVISRNLTWTLPDAAKAYRQWCRVLKEDGIVLNFDANYGNADFKDTSHLPSGHAHNMLGDAMMQECEEIKRQLPISSYIRPAWDIEELTKAGMNRINIDMGISQRVYRRQDEFYNPTPMFAICAGRKEV